MGLWLAKSWHKNVKIYEVTIAFPFTSFNSKLGSHTLKNTENVPGETNIGSFNNELRKNHMNFSYCYESIGGDNK